MIFWNEKTPFQAIKTRSLNSRKFDIFPKGLTHGFRRKMAIFLNFFLLGNEGQENLFYGILERKNVFLGYKNKKLKKSKNCHFSKGVNPWFWLKNGHFFNFFFWLTQARKMSFLIFQHEKRPFQSIKTRSSNSRKFDIFPNGLTHGFGPKMAIFPIFFFQAIQYRKMSFMIFQNEKTPFQAIKTRSLKSRKVDTFPNGLTNGFSSKMAIFPIFFFFFSCNIRQENVFYGILERKNAFLGYKNKKFIKSKN